MSARDEERETPDEEPAAGEDPGEDAEERENRPDLPCLRACHCCSF